MSQPCQDAAQPFCVPFTTETETSHENTQLNDVDTVPASVHVPQLLPKRIIQVHWLITKKEMIDLFRDRLIVSQDIEVIVIDAGGVQEVGRSVGLCRVAFSLFWKETYDSLFVGEN